MRESITRNQLIEEIKHIPENRLPEIYDFLHFSKQYSIGKRDPYKTLRDTIVNTVTSSELSGAMVQGRAL